MQSKSVKQNLNEEIRVPDFITSRAVFYSDKVFNAFGVGHMASLLSEGADW